MLTLQELQAYRVALLKAIYSGVLTVKHGETLNTFQSIDQMLKALALLDAQIAALADDTPRVRTFTIHPRSGY